ncbi:MAG: thymidine phosphorylase [Gammaproteobacteria bacterium]|nr:thymidine phosphorylase [Gammaproteobacteria bacterium]
MLFKEVIRHKRDGGELDAGHIELFVDGLTDGSLPSEQAAALAMAILLRSMTAAEAGLLTSAMAQSGTVLDWHDGPPVIDKHSTGGVGDKVSLMLAPIAAACGCRVPMISGRGLGHTGGTLDKMASIPGYDVSPPLDTLRRVVDLVGCAIIGQTPELAPADRRLYAIRDVTGTVESIPLITASILSKKIAAGNGALVMDIKVGSGAFMTTLGQARELANSIVSTAAAAGLPTTAVITDMNEPLGTTVGNALEVHESIAYLRNETTDSRLHEVVMRLASEMLVLAGLATDSASAHQAAMDVLRSGAAAECFARMVRELGGPADLLDRPLAYLDEAPYQEAIMAPRAAYLAAIDTRAIGNALISLGGGRRDVDDRLDNAVGFTAVASIGSHVNDIDRPVAIVHAADADAAAAATENYLAACTFSDEQPQTSPVIVESA